MNPTLESLAELATTTLADILRDPEATRDQKIRAAAIALRHASAERNLDLARERLERAAARRRKQESPSADSTPDPSATAPQHAPDPAADPLAGDDDIPLDLRQRIAHLERLRRKLVSPALASSAIDTG